MNIYALQEEALISALQRALVSKPLQHNYLNTFILSDKSTEDHQLSESIGN